ncbi:hypothetical protein HDU96_000711 [Phlyctochytrium bullatum]|nr:hypothetical protein HDU96_000711 [Phlyctochytrium bullatum]
MWRRQQAEALSKSSLVASADEDVASGAAAALAASVLERSGRSGHPPPSAAPSRPPMTAGSTTSNGTRTSTTGRRNGTPPFRTGTSTRGPPSVPESMASEASLSPETRALFKNMMRSSKLTTTQQRFLDELVKDGYSLPATPQPGMTGRFSTEPPESLSVKLSAALPAPRRKAMNFVSQLRPSIRTKNAIVESGDLEPEHFRPKATKNLAEEKKRLQWLMESNGSTEEAGNDEEMGASKASGKEGDGEDLDEFKMVFQEIQERRQWLDDMIALGHGEQYKRQIQQEIALRLKRLEDIDKERSKKERSRFPALAAMLSGPSTGGNQSQTAGGANGSTDDDTISAVLMQDAFKPRGKLANACVSGKEEALGRLSVRNSTAAAAASAE